MGETNKLYRVTLKGMTSNPTGTSYGISYVIAKDSNEAYLKVREFLNKKDIGFDRERELSSIDLIAEDSQYTNTGTILYL